LYKARAFRDLRLMTARIGRVFFTTKKKKKKKKKKKQKTSGKQNLTQKASYD
jgi:hypothetical protein